MPGGPTGDRGHWRQWKKMEAQEGEMIDADGEAYRGWRRQATGRKRNRPRREGAARGPGDLRDGGHQAPPWAVAERERRQGVANAVRAWDGADEPGGSAGHEEQWEKGGGQCKRHCGDSGSVNGPTSGLDWLLYGGFWSRVLPITGCRRPPLAVQSGPQEESKSIGSTCYLL